MPHKINIVSIMYTFSLRKYEKTGHIWKFRNRWLGTSQQYIKPFFLIDFRSWQYINTYQAKIIILDPRWELFMNNQNIQFIYSTEIKHLKNKKQLLYLQPCNDHVRQKNHKFSFIVLKSKAGLQRLRLCLENQRELTLSELQHKKTIKGQPLFSRTIKFHFGEDIKVIREVLK